MLLDNISTYASIFASCTTILALIAAAWVAYGIFLASSLPDVFIEVVAFSPKQYLLDNDSEYPYVFSLQFRFLNPAVGSKVVTEITIGETIIRNKNSEVVWIPIGYLPIVTLLHLTASDIKLEGIYHPLVMVGHGLEKQHVVFTPKDEGLPDEFSGEIKVEVVINYKVHNPILRVIGPPKQTPLKMYIEFTMKEPLNESKLRMFQSNYFSQRISKVKQQKINTLWQRKR